MNGVFEDTVEFGEFLYKEFAEGETSDVYLDQSLDSYMYRVDSIYRPKAEFMCDAIWEHGGDPASIELLAVAGVDYVSCSPPRIPIARLAAAQIAIKTRADR